MTQKTFTRTAGVIFVLVAVLHLLRLLLGWEAVIGGWDVPMWVSGLALVLSAYLAYSAFRLRK
jgi:hypothetical protein